MRAIYLAHLVLLDSITLIWLEAIISQASELEKDKPLCFTTSSRCIPVKNTSGWRKTESYDSS